MSKLLSLQSRKKVIDTIYRASCAMKATASVSMHKIQLQMESFSAIHNLINENDYLIKQYLKQETISKKSATILISSNKGMCGDFSNQINTYFKSNQKNYDYWIFFGKKLEEIKKSENIFYCGQADINEDTLFEQANKIYEYCKKNDVTELNIAYFSDKIIIKEIIYSDSDSDDLNEIIKEETTQKNLKLPEEFTIFFLTNKIYDAMLKSSLEENKQRMLAMNQAKNNAEEIGKTVLRLYNRARQEKITCELNEITSGII